MSTRGSAEPHDEVRFPASLPTVMLRFGALVTTVVAFVELRWAVGFGRDVAFGLGRHPVASEIFVRDLLWAVAVFAVLAPPLVLAPWWAWTGLRRRSGFRILAAPGVVGAWPLLLVLPPVWALGWLVA